ncbi:MAG: DNA adenine methylase [Actinomycetota bacterium]|nr:DNA adenine methylase [Actinomycetota bacterium]
MGTTRLFGNAPSSDSILVEPPLHPFLKWPGGKASELAMIAAASPPLTGRYVDPFVGGGSVLLAIAASVPAAANDACPELVLLFSALASADPAVLDALDGVATAWDGLAREPAELQKVVDAFTTRAATAPVPGFAAALEPAGPGLREAFDVRLPADVASKLTRMRAVEAKAGHRLSDADLLANVEGSVRASFYLTIRERYNRARTQGTWDAWRLADFFFLREFAYASMFRFNKRDEFNVPYGGVTYNRKSMLAKVAQATAPAMRERLAATEWHVGDFEPFLDEVGPQGDDFVFVDPPYDSQFSDYDNRAFSLGDQHRLEAALRRLDCPVMVVIKDSAGIRDLYEHAHWRIAAAGKTYMWTIKSRNDRSAVHLTITNY